jgi:arginine repressor
MLVRAHVDEILGTLWEYIDKDPQLAHVYLLVDGHRSQQDIVAALRKAGVSSSDATVSRKLGVLRNELGLIEKIDHTASGVTHRKSEIDRILHLSSKIERRLAAILKTKAAKGGKAAEK